MIKNLYVIRHGEAEHLIGGTFTGGWTHSNLTERGRSQSLATGKRIANLLKESEVDFYCSDLSRAMETAEIIGKYISKRPIPAKELRELNNGDAANLTQEEAAKIAFPKSKPLLDYIHYPNSESRRNMSDRVFSFMDTISIEAKETVVIISHVGPIISIIDWWLEFNECYINKVSFDVEPCSITYLRFNKWEEKTISKLNETTHLR